MVFILGSHNMKNYIEVFLLTAGLSLPVPKLVDEAPTMTGHYLNENSNSEVPQRP